MYSTLKKILFYSFCSLFLSSVSRVQAADSGIQIIVPTEKDILYGQSKIRASINPGVRDEISRVDFYLGVLPNPVCRDSDYPYECEIDVGDQLQGWEITAKAYVKDGKPLGEASVRTRDFPKPMRVSRYILSNIPVRVDRSAREGSAILIDKDLSCRFGDGECQILSLSKLSDLLEKENEGTFNAYLEFIVDLSESMEISTEKVREGLEYIVDLIPKNTKVRLSSFSDYKSLKILTISNDAGFTLNRKIIHNAVDKIRWSEGKTCLFSNVEKLMDDQPPHKIIRRVLLITDCYDTCDDLSSRENIIDHARELADVIDIYRTENYKGTREEIFKCETLATATGGGVIDGESTDLVDAMKKIISDMNETYLLDIGLPDNVKTDRARKLQLIPVRKDIKLKYPELHQAGIQEQLCLNMLKSEHPLVKSQALKKLGYGEDPKTIEALIDAYQKERDQVLKEDGLAVICNLIGSNLLHKEDLKSKKLALKAAEKLREVDPELTERLEPFLQVFLKKESDKKLKIKASSFID